MSIISEMIEIYKSLKADGVEQVKVDNLIKFTEGFQEDKEIDKSHANAYYLEQLRAQNDSNLEMFRSVISYGQASLKYGVLLCGSAAIAILTFMGNIVDKHPEWLKPCSDSLLCFTVGAFNIGFCVFMTYLTQYFYSKEWNRWGNAFCYGTWVVGALSLSAAIIGSVIFYKMF